jgi:hypothetical protein
MGLSASQARYLGLTARKSDKEYQAQQINQQRLEISDKLQEISTAYTDGINNRQLMFSVPVGNGSEVTKVALSYSTITAQYPEGLGYKLVEASSGRAIQPSSESVEERIQNLKDEADKKYNSAINDSYYFVDNSSEEGQLSGANLASFLSSSNYTVNNALGETVDNATLAETVKDMSSTELHSYFSEQGYSFNNIVLEKVDGEKYTAATQARYDAYNKAEALRNEQSDTSIYDDRCNDNDYLEKQLRNGTWMLQKVNQDGEYENVSYSSVGNIVDELDTSDDAKVTADYDSQTEYWEQKDKQLELQLQQIETEHSSIETEIDSVKKVIEKNVEASFKTFA